MQYHVITRGLSKNNIFVDVNHTFSWNHIIKIIAKGVNFFVRKEIFMSLYEWQFRIRSKFEILHIYDPKNSGLNYL